MKMTRRDALKAAGAGAAGAMMAMHSMNNLAMAQQASGQQGQQQANGAVGEYTLMPLPYEYDALEPVIDERTLRLHHDKHHAGYVSGANDTLRKLAVARRDNDFAYIRALERDLAFNASGVLLHNLYWHSMRRGGGANGPQGELEAHLVRDFGSVDAFRSQFAAAAKNVHGSGWGLLAWEPALNKLVVLQIDVHQNQTIWGVCPLLVVDVWEHAYYLQYQNERGKHVDRWMEIIDWQKTASRYNQARQQFRRS